MSITLLSFVITFRCCIEFLSSLKKKRIFLIALSSVSLQRVKSTTTFRACLLASRRLFLIVCLLLPIGDFNSHVVLVLGINMSGVLLMVFRIKNKSLRKCSARSNAAFHSCGRIGDLVFLSEIIWKFLAIAKSIKSP